MRASKMQACARTTHGFEKPQDAHEMHSCVEVVWPQRICGHAYVTASHPSTHPCLCCILQGEYSMRPSCWRILAAVAVDTLLVVGLPVWIGVLATLSFKTLTAEHQSFGERMLRLQPVMEVVRPMHFSPYSPARVGGVSIGSDDDEGY